MAIQITAIQIMAIQTMAIQSVYCCLYGMLHVLCVYDKIVDALTPSLPL